MPKNYCVVDIGTIKVKTIIASLASDGNLETVYSSNNLTCFGCDLDQNGGYVKEEFLKRTIDELKRIKEVISRHNVAKTKVVSTHAMRRAKNRKEIMQRIQEETGFAVENISQEKEAEFFFNAVMRSFTSDREYVVVDVGGGSVQILVGTPRKLTYAHMMQTGAQFLHDTYTTNPNSPQSRTNPEDISKMKAAIMGELASLEKISGIPLIYGSSMIIDVMKNLGMPLERHEDSLSHPYLTRKRHLEEYIEKILPLSYEEREAAYSAGQRGYVWGADKAFLNVVTIAEHFESPYIIPSNANIAQGIIYSMIEESTRASKEEASKPHLHRS